MSLKILTLNWNGKEKLEKLYNSLLPNLENIKYIWFIKDNHSTDGGIELIKSFNNPNIDLTEYPHNNDNFAEGCNFLFKKANPEPDDLILLLNNDVIFNDSKSIKKMINIIENDSNVGVVGARLFYTGTDLLQHAGVVFNNSHTMPWHFRAKQKNDDNSSKDREFSCVTGALLLTKSKFYSGNMNNSFRWSFDDINLCMSIKYKLGKKIVYCGGTNVFHEESASLKKNPVNKLFLNHNVNLFKSLWPNRVLDENLYIKDPNYNLYKGSSK